MKHFLLLLSFFTFHFGISQNVEFTTISESEVPTFVIENQRTLFPNSYISAWKQQSGASRIDTTAVRYISEFEVGGRKGYSASYLPSGNLIFHSQFMDLINLPEPIRLKAEQQHENFEIDQAYFVTVYNPRMEIYNLRLRDESTVKYLYYDSNSVRLPEESLPIELILFNR